MCWGRNGECGFALAAVVMCCAKQEYRAKSVIIEELAMKAGIGNSYWYEECMKYKLNQQELGIQNQQKWESCPESGIMSHSPSRLFEPVGSQIRVIIYGGI